MNTLPYLGTDIEKFNHLLSDIMTDPNKTESDIRRLIPDSKQFDIVHTINDHYHSFNVVNGFYRITSTGLEIQVIGGLKEYFNKIRIEQQLDLKIKEHTLREFDKIDERFTISNRKAKYAIWISILSPIVLFCIERTFDYYENNRPNNANYDCNGRIEITQPIFINDTISKSSSSYTKNKIINLTHIDSLNFKLILKKKNNGL